MVFLGRINSRMKDFYDLWLLTSNYKFDDQILRDAIAQTFHHRNTPIPDDIPVALSDSFAQEKNTQWQAFVERSRLGELVPEFISVIQELRAFVMHHLEAIRNEHP